MAATLSAAGAWTGLRTDLRPLEDRAAPPRTTLALHPGDLTPVPDEIRQLIDLAVAGWGAQLGSGKRLSAWAAAGILRQFFAAYATGHTFVPAESVNSLFANLFAVEAANSFTVDTITPFSMTMLSGKLYVAGYDAPSLFARLEDPFGNLATYTKAALGFDFCIQSIYRVETDRFYCAMQHAPGSTIIVRVVPTTLVPTTVVNDPTIPFGEGSIDSDGTSLFVTDNRGTGLGGARLHKYDLATFGVHTASAGLGVTTQAPVACLSDSGKVYVVGHNSGVARFDGGTLAIEQNVQMPNEAAEGPTPFDDVASDATTLYVPGYAYPYLYALQKTDLTQFVKTPYGAGIVPPGLGTGIVRSGTKLYLTLGATPGMIARFDTATGVMQVHRFAVGECDLPEEILISGGRLFVACSTSPAKMVRLIEIG